MYEVGLVGQYVDEETDEVVMKSFDVVSKAFDEKVAEIEEECWSDEESLFFITDNSQLYNAREKKKAKALKRAMNSSPQDEDLIALYQPTEYVPNFRDVVAKKKVYKGNRKSSRPLHYDNLVAYVCATRDVICAEGCEADDLLAIEQTKSEPLSTVICSRDKDLKIIPGMHYGWACGKQLPFPLAEVSVMGGLELAGGKKLSGTGLKFFYSQVLTGDATDNYPGLPRCGPVKAFNTLEQCNDEGKLFEATSELYRSFYGDVQTHEYAVDEPSWHIEMNEQAQLAWMVSERNEDGSLKHYVMYDIRTDN